MKAVVPSLGLHSFLFSNKNICEMKFVVQGNYQNFMNKKDNMCNYIIQGLFDASCCKRPRVKSAGCHISFKLNKSRFKDLFLCILSQL